MITREKEFKTYKNKKQKPPIAPQASVGSKTPHRTAATRGTRSVQTLNGEEI